MNQKTFKFEEASFTNALQLVSLTDGGRMFALLMYRVSRSGDDAMRVAGVTAHEGYEALWMHADQESLGKALGGVSERTVQRYVAELVKKKLLVTEKASNGTNLYNFSLAMLREQTLEDTTDELNAWILKTGGDPHGIGIGRHPETQTTDHPTSHPTEKATSDTTTDPTPSPPMDMVQENTKPMGSMVPWDFKILGWGKGNLTDDDVLRIVRERNLAAFEFLDNEGLTAFEGRGAWIRTDAMKRKRAAMWHSAVNYPNTKAGQKAAAAGKKNSAAGLLKSYLRSGKCSLNDADEDWAASFLKRRQVSPPSAVDETKPEPETASIGGVLGEMSFTERREQRKRASQAEPNE